MDQHYELTSTPELLTLAAYVSKESLVGHHWKERPIGHANCQLAVMLMIKAESDVHKVVSRLSQRLNRKYPTNQVRVYYHAQKIEQNGSQPAAN